MRVKKNPGPVTIIMWIALAFALVYMTVWAGDARAGANVTVMSGFLSVHPGDGISNTTGQPYKQNNYGLGLRVDEGPLYGWMFGTYVNSHDRQSLYLAKEWKSSRVGPFQLGLVAGAATGYKSLIMPALMPEFIINMWRAEMVFLAQPFKSGSTDPMVAMQLRWRFW